MFETVIDGGLFQTFDSVERRIYVAGLASVTSHGGNLYVLCFSDVDPDTASPHPVGEQELRAAFHRSSGWSVASISPDRIQGFAPHGAPAWLAKIGRL